MKKGLIVTHPEAAKVLTETGQLRLLEPFFKDEVVLSKVARQFGIKLNTLHYRVNKWMDLGLVEVGRTELRRGKATKLYRASAEAFFVPFELTPSSSVAELLSKLSYVEEALFQREAAKTLRHLSPELGLLVTLQEGQLGVTFADKQLKTLAPETFFGPEAPALYVGDGTLELDFATAKAMQRDLLELYRRYAARETLGAQSYAYRLGLAPVTP